MKKDKKHRMSQQQHFSDKRFSIKEFLKKYEPETTHWYKLNDDDADFISILNRKHKDNDERVKSAVRGMTNSIVLQILSDLDEHGEYLAW